MDRVWVIGGSQGIGEVITETLEKKHMEVHPTSEQSADVRSTQALLRMYNDVQPTVIVYVAGINKLMPAASFDEWSALNIMDINVLGFMRVINLIAENMETQQPPRSVVAISSDAAVTPMRNSMAYCSSKAALNMAVRCAARELAPHVQINAVAPGQVADTPHTDEVDKQVSDIKGWTLEQTIQQSEVLIPTGRRSTKQEVADTVYLLLKAPAQLTGTIVNITGGK